MCVLGRQWVRKVTVRSDAQSWKARTIWHVERMRRAAVRIRALVERLYRSLLLSIGFFIVALLFQLWNLVSSFEERPTLLLATWFVRVVLASGNVNTMVATICHAVRYEGSLFEGLVSNIIFGDANLGAVDGLRSSGSGL